MEKVFENQDIIKKLYPNINKELGGIKPLKLDRFSFSQEGKNFTVENPSQSKENAKTQVKRMVSRLEIIDTKGKLPLLIQKNHINPQNIPNNSIQLLIFNEGERENYLSIEEAKKIIIDRQIKSLEPWVEWLSASDYPVWFKYKTIRSVINADNEGSKRRSDTTSEFIDFNNETIDILYQEFSQNVHTNFIKVYKELTKGKTIEGKETTKGEWREFNLSENGIEELSRLTKGTGWCTQNKYDLLKYKNDDPDAKFYIYFCDDLDNNPTIPSLCIRVAKQEVVEVCGKDGNVKQGEQKVPEYLSDIAFQKSIELGAGKEIRQKYKDTKLLEKLFRRITKNPECALTREELLFLYEVEKPIQTMGQSPNNFRKVHLLKDFRLAKTREDWSIIKDLQVEEVAQLPLEVTKNTKFVIEPYLLYSSEQTPIWFLTKYIKSINFESPAGEDFMSMRPLINNSNTPVEILLKILDTNEFDSKFCQNNEFAHNEILKTIITRTDFKTNCSMVYELLQNQNINPSNIKLIFQLNQHDNFLNNQYARNINTPEDILYKLLQGQNIDNMKEVEYESFINNPNCSKRIVNLVISRLKSLEKILSDEYIKKVLKIAQIKKDSVSSSTASFPHTFRNFCVLQ